MSDIGNMPAFNRICGRLMPSPLPARTLVQAGLLGIDVEVGVIAMPDARHGAPFAALGRAMTMCFVRTAIGRTVTDPFAVGVERARSLTAKAPRGRPVV